MKNLPKNLTEAQLLVRLREKYPAPEYASFGKVRNGTGYSRATARTADFVAMSLWPSRGLHLHGFEIKSSRSDWMREKRDPEKAEDIASRCDFWWVVTGHENVVQKDELPTPWGLMVPYKTKLLVVKEAVQLQAKPLDREFLAAILRRAQEDSPGKAEIAEAATRVANEWRVKMEEAVETAHRRGKAESEQALSDHRRVLADFEKVSGITIDRWDHGNIGLAVKAILALGRGTSPDDFIRQKANDLRSAADRVMAVLEKP